ncbi:MAG: methyltransferase domain-containing protein [Balneolaceae bacterium]|nr:methyltransferase domain-containing protein [Balneolaceae bacterium]
MKKVLNVGGNNRGIPLPPEYDNGWKQVILDVDDRGDPDIVCDARELTDLEGGRFDAVYCSHTLEHFYRHDVPKVLAGFRHVLTGGGFADIRVPDLKALFRVVSENDLDIDDELYEAPIGTVTVRDVIYGYGEEIERSGSDWFAHKTGFSPQSLRRILNRCGFRWVYLSTGNLEVRAVALEQKPGGWVRELFGLPEPKEP